MIATADAATRRGAASTRIVGLDDQAEVEYELVALVLGIGDGHGKAQDAVLPIRISHRDIAVEEGFARNDVLLQHVEVEEARLTLRRVFDGHDAARRRLCHDLCAWREMSA